MARMPRLYVEGTSQHMVQRGNNRDVCFFCEADYALYLQNLREASEKYDVAVHAFVLMTNHVHLLVTPSSKEGVPRMMQALGRNYVRYVNITYRRSGTLWEGRYKSPIVGGDCYFLTVSRYIEQNPLRAKMVSLPGEYPWSSYLHNAMGLKIELISEHESYIKLGASKASRLRAYRELFGVALPKSVVDEIRLCTNKEWIIGNEKFKNQIQYALGWKVNDRPIKGSETLI